jgi:hypothetical protein
MSSKRIKRIGTHVKVKIGDERKLMLTFVAA